MMELGQKIMKIVEMITNVIKSTQIWSEMPETRENGWEYRSNGQKTTRTIENYVKIV